MHRIFLLAIAGAHFATVIRADGGEIPVPQETLGQWHYLHDLAVRTFANTQTPSAAVTFGRGHTRLAVMMPGSYVVAEFKAGRFYDLLLPADLMPSALAADAKGELYCLAQNKVVTNQNWNERWITSLGTKGWSRPERTPIDPCDQLTFDRKDRLWALGPAGSVACRWKGKWDTYAYSDSAKLHYAPVRLTANAAGEPVLFADWRPERDREISHLVGTLTYHSGQYSREPLADTTALVQAEIARVETNGAVSAGPAEGYLVQKEIGFLRVRTVVHFQDYTVVAMGADGLVWTSRADVAAKPLSVDDEWDKVDHVFCSPIADWERGTLWVVRTGPPRFVRIRADKTDEFPIAPTASLPQGGGEATIDVDLLGRPWLMSWHGSGQSVILLKGDHTNSYDSLGAGLASEAGAYPAGRIFPFAVKAPSGLIGMGGGYFGEFTVIDGSGVHALTPSQINPAEAEASRHASHGYDPLRGGEPWIDREGRLHTAVIGTGFVYDGGKWTVSPMDPAKDAMIPPPPEEEGPVVSEDESKVASYHQSETVFRGFHFYREEAGGEKQLDFGLNPLARYPFAAGLTPTTVDPLGRIWIGPTDYFYNRDTVWWVGPKNP